MPETKCLQPIKDGNPNFMLKDIKIDGKSIADFSFSKDTYLLNVENSVSHIEISAQAIDKGANISGTGKIELYPGMNVIQLKCVAENGDEKTYKLNITRNY